MFDIGVTSRTTAWESEGHLCLGGDGRCGPSGHIAKSVSFLYFHGPEDKQIFDAKLVLVIVCLISLWVEQ